MDDNNWQNDWDIQGREARHKQTGCAVRVKAREVEDEGLTGEARLRGRKILYSLDVDDIPRERMDLANQAMELWKSGKLGAN